MAAILLAAGESTRMGQLKALLPWEGQVLLAYQVEQLLASPIERVIVVLGHRAEDLRRLLPPEPRLVPVVNARYRSGKVSSILAGLQHVPAGWHVLVLGVDQPRPSALIRRAVEHHLAGGALITVAGYGGRRGHPVIFAPALRPALEQLSEATQGLRAVLAAHAGAVALCETGDPLALVNLNTTDDYVAALRLTSSTSSARAGNQ